MLCLTVLAKIWEGTTQIESQVMLHHLELRLHIYLKSVASSSAEFSWSLVNHHFVVCISGVAVGLGESGVALSRCNRPPASCICCTTNTFRLGNALWLVNDVLGPIGLQNGQVTTNAGGAATTPKVPGTALL